MSDLPGILQTPPASFIVIPRISGGIPRLACIPDLTLCESLYSRHLSAIPSLRRRIMEGAFALPRLPPPANAESPMAITGVQCLQSLKCLQSLQSVQCVRARPQTFMHPPDRSHPNCSVKVRRRPFHSAPAIRATEWPPAGAFSMSAI
jgi:hypothetical protein